MKLSTRTVASYGTISLLVFDLIVNCFAGNPNSQNLNLLNSSTTALPKRKQEVIEKTRDNRQLSPPQFRRWRNCPDGEAYVDEVSKCLKQGKYKSCFVS